MLTAAEVRELLAEFVRDVKSKPTLLGTVTKVDKAECTCTIDDDGSEYLNVRLRPVTGENVGMVLYPKIGAFALAVKVEESEDWMVLYATAHDSIEITIESLIMNDGKLGGLVNINELTAKLNGFINSYNMHTHPVPDGTSSATASTVQAFKASDYEDTKVKH